MTKDFCLENILRLIGKIFCDLGTHRESTAASNQGKVHQDLYFLNSKVDGNEKRGGSGRTQ